MSKAELAIAEKWPALPLTLAVSFMSSSRGVRNCGRGGSPWFLAEAHPTY